MHKEILLKGHYECFNWFNEWHGLTIKDVHCIENETSKALKKVNILIKSTNNLINYK